ncbi:MAG: putative metal-binding motif-containing protein [Polyangiaceae bacterium]|nr:putative metal-binding motif-containing protein [Polyangiaceae bacterium]
MPGTPVAEICDGLDNNCDGTPDDGDPGAGLTCSTGLLGVCAAGTTACVSVRPSPGRPGQRLRSTSAVRRE